MKAVAYSTDGAKLPRAEGVMVVVCDVVSGFELCRLRGHSKQNPECICQHGENQWDYKAKRRCPATGHSYWWDRLLGSTACQHCTGIARTIKSTNVLVTGRMLMSITTKIWTAQCVCVALFYYTDIGESLRSRGQFLTAVDLGWPDPHPPP